MLPKSLGGRATVPLHPICHRAIHAAVANKALARRFPTVAALRAEPEVARFLAWIARRPPDFDAPTRRRR